MSYRSLQVCPRHGDARGNSPIDPWIFARDRYVEDLDEEEKWLFANASLENLFHSTCEAQRHHEENDRLRAVFRRLEPFVVAIEQYGRALDVYTNTFPLAMAPLWGSIRVLLHIARAYEKYFEKLTDMLTRIGDILPRCQVYQRLFPNHERLLQAISVAYLDIIHFCVDAKAVFRKLKRLATAHLTLKFLWKDFDKEFEAILNKFRTHVKNIEKEATVSNMLEHSAERDLLRADRVENERQRKRKFSKREFLLSQLSSHKYIDKHLRERRKRHPGTGTWLAQNGKFKAWVAADHSTCLWCFGIPGLGKTVLASGVIDMVLADIVEKDICFQAFSSQDIIDRNITRKEAAIAFYYCDFSDPKSLEVPTIFGTILRELLENIVIPDALEQQLDRFCRPSLRTTGNTELNSILCETINYFSEVYIFIDGLDECGHDEQVTVLSMINQLGQSSKSVVKILITSREEHTIATSLKLFPHLQLAADWNSSDIATYIEEVVKEKMRSGKLIQNPCLESEIISSLANGAQGMFLWVRFQLIDLCEAATISAAREVLRNLPKGMEETYARILQKIGKLKANMDLAQRVFKWIVCAKRPLLATELAEAVAFGPADRSWDEEKIPEPWRLVKACGSLVTFDKNDRTVRLAHHSFQQFLLKAPMEFSIPEFHFQLPQADIMAGETCLAYLSFSDFETQVTRSKPGNPLLASIPGPTAVVDSVTGPLGLKHITSWISKLGKFLQIWDITQPQPAFDVAKFVMTKKPPPPNLREKYALLDYTIENWLGHTSNFSENNTNTWNLFRHVVMDKPMAFDIRPWGNNIVSNEIPYTSVFCWAVETGHVPILKLLLQIMGNLGLHAYCLQESEQGRSVVLSAAHRAHANVIQFLLKHAHIAVNGKRLLIDSARGGSDVAVRTLLECGIGLGARAEALQIATDVGYAKVMRVLLENEYPLDLQSGWGNAALTNTGMNGFDDAVVVLLSSALCSSFTLIELERMWGEPPLHFAAGRGFHGTVRLVLDKGAKVNAEDNVGRTALHCAAHGNHKAVARLLLENGAGVDARDKSGLTPLHIAANNNNEAIAQLLVEKGAHINEVDDKGQTPLDLTAQRGHGAMAGLLMEMRANARDALQAASSQGHGNVVQQLLENGADVNAQSEKYGTALQTASSYGHVKIVQQLLEWGADVNAQGGEWGTALGLASWHGHVKVVQQLLEWGADVNAQPAIYGTALHLASSRGHVKIVQQLLNKGVDVNIQCEVYGTALHRASSIGHGKIVQQLLKSGADINAKGGDYGTALIAALSHGHVKIVEQLLENGADVNAEGGEYGTALQVASSHGYDKIVKQLLDNGADVNTQGGKYGTALQAALSQGHDKIVRQLKDKGAQASRS